MANVGTAGSGGSEPWYRALTGRQWNTLIACNLGWLFDGFETYALILTAGPAMRQLLDPAQHPQIPAYIGTVIAITLLGWGIGGMMGGILADYLGRKRTMILAIVAYSIMTGLSAISWNWLSFAVLRFLVGIAIGSEWATGTSIIAELWPDSARGKGAGLMQCGLGVGFFVASFVWLLMAPIGDGSWRYMYLVGILPALMTLWIRASVPESALWQRADERRHAAVARKRSGRVLDTNQQKLARFTLFDLFSEPERRRRTIIVFLMSLTTTLAWWGISSWVPLYVGSVAAASGRSAPTWASYAGMAYTVGSVLGYVALGFLADALGRRPVTIGFYVLSLVLTPALFLWTQDLALLLILAFINGTFTCGQYTWMPVWMPELYPTRMRGTAIAFAFNAPRFIAFLGPLLSGSLIVHFGGFGKAATSVALIYILGIVAAMFLPETRARPLPE
jgi:MFS family permease